MPRFHRHHEIELNFVEQGLLTYLFGGATVTISAGQFVLFWAVVPHQTIYVEPATIYHCLTVPLTQFLQWRLPAALKNQVLRELVVRDGDAAHTAIDRVLFKQWQSDLRAESPERRAIVLLEVEARLRRLALTSAACAAEPAGARALLSAAGREKVELMARTIAERYAEPLRIADIAATAGLHPNYAMQLFRKTFGMSLLDYLTQYRVAQAQRLLVTADATILAIAMECGFGSTSRFYAAFKRVCGTSPGAYRASLAAWLRANER
jgi:AraC-like DNA-binding protein